MDDYVLGTDVLGAAFGTPPVDPGGGPFVTVHFRDPAGLVKAKGGSAGATIFKLAPQTLTSKIYNDTRDKIEAGMKAEGADAEVKVVTTRPSGGPFARDFLVGSVVGAGGVGLIVGAVRLFKHFLGRR